MAPVHAEHVVPVTRTRGRSRLAAPGRSRASGAEDKGELGRGKSCFKVTHFAANGSACRVPVDPLEWQISQEMANSIVASLANTIGAAESVLRVAATGHDKKLLFKVVFTLYFLAALGRVVSGAAIAYAALCIFSLYMFVQSTDQFDQLPWVPLGRDSLGGAQDTT
ncbi:Reticulon-like protein B23 [Triticum urartu]|uniref:Reticulon-like protein B23 n=1 Tax=Triticum urartu TaxID=4572 RepID=M8AVD4_TRIUA|nr:Reticulon-like protein B23 [Triticum urartu]